MFVDKDKVFVRGDSGAGVKALQEQLNQNGASLDVDGVFGPQTEAAVRDLQANNGITVDGKVGPETKGVLEQIAGTLKDSFKGLSGYVSANPSTGAAVSGSSGGGASGGGSSASSNEFTYDDYKESDTVSQALTALEQQLAANPGDYRSTWQGQINSIIDRILNREDFSYDVNSDALYQQYKDQYSSLGKLAMQDTMGQAAAMTGGYGSSYASTAGNQAYQSYLQQLNEVVPELYGMARDQYNQEGQEMYNQYALLSDQENQDYGRYLDQYNQWASETDRLQGVYSDERNFDYGKYSDDKSYAYDEYRNAISDQQWEKNYQLNQEAFELEKDAYKDSTKSFSGTTDSGVDYNNGSLTNGQIKELQAALGLEATGLYGERAKKAAGGLSAEEAYAKYVGSTSGTAEINYLSPEEHVEALSTIEGYLEDGNTFAAEEFIDYLYMSERIDDETYLAWRKHYLPTTNGIIDTTVNPTLKGVVSGGIAGARNAMNSIKN